MGKSKNTPPAKSSSTGPVPVIPPLSSTPALGDDTQISSLMNNNGESEQAHAAAEDGSKSTKRRFWGLSKKGAEPKAEKSEQMPAPSTVPRVPNVAPLRPVSPFNPSERLAAASPNRGSHSQGAVASPTLSAMSPRPHSPASSQIFERSVQEEVVPSQASPQIPSHIITENHIPPVLEEASAAITDTHLDPDSVEIVTHTLHQPAALTVTGTPAGEMSMASSVFDDTGYQREAEESRSNVASLEASDVRRLSFVSFADVVHGEHVAETGDLTSLRDSAHLSNLHGTQRSPSPIRSPASSHGLGTSPPTSVSPSFHPVDSTQSTSGPRHTGSNNPQTHSPPLGGELNVETMRQALQKTGNEDVSIGGIGGSMLSAGAYEE